MDKPPSSLWSPPGSRSIIGQPVSSAVTPAFVVEKKIVQRNCADMLDTCRRLGVALRAQIKTHKTVEAAILQTGGSKRCLVCSTLDECEMLADNSFDDVLFGHPLVAHDMERVEKLTRHMSEFHVMVDSLDAAQLLASRTPPADRRWSMFLKVDCGNKRAGVWHEDVSQACDIVRLVLDSTHITFAGLYVHCGDTYGATDLDNLYSIRDKTIDRLLKFREQLESRTGHRCTTIGVGSTPSCRLPSQSMDKLTELHPGNYAFLDVQMHLLGCCTLDDIAGSVATRVIGHYPHRNQLLVDCGFTALTKQGWGKMDTGYGVIKGNANLKLSKMNQEHGFIEPLDASEKLDYSQYPLGHMFFIFPYHSCATANMHSQYLVVEEGVVKEEWKPTRGW